MPGPQARVRKRCRDVSPPYYWQGKGDARRSLRHKVGCRCMTDAGQPRTSGLPAHPLAANHPAWAREDIKDAEEVIRLHAHEIRRFLDQQAAEQRQTVGGHADPAKTATAPPNRPAVRQGGGGVGPGAILLGGGRATGAGRAQGHGATCPPHSCHACFPCCRFHCGAGRVAVHWRPGQETSASGHSATRAGQGATGLACGRSCSGAGQGRDCGRTGAGCPRASRYRAGAARLRDRGACYRAVQGGPDTAHGGGGDALT